MRIGIIGTGHMGSSLGKLWADHGHEVFFGSRDPDRARHLARTTGGASKGGTYAEASQYGEVILLATRWDETEQAVAACGPLMGRIIIDCTNPLSADDFLNLALGYDNSGAETVSQWAAGSKVVKAFNTITSHVLRTGPDFHGQRATAFLCGDDQEAKMLARKLIEDTGFEPLDLGPLRMARFLEPMAEVVINLAYAANLGPDIALKMLRR